MNDYANQGYKDRADYLRSLCEEYPAHAVYALAGVLGPNEDFDGLITMLEDAMDSGEFDE